MQAEPATQAACAVIAEVTASLCGEGDGDHRVYRLLKAVLEALRDDLDAAVSLRYFEFWMLRLHGLLPDLATCVYCHDELAGGKTAAFGTIEGMACGECAGEGGGQSRALAGGERAFLREVGVRRPGEMRGHEAAARAGGVLEWMLRGGLQAFADKEFRTYRHFRSAARAGITGDRKKNI
jgi:recombinational DNA repair protein (RecF pathway)